MKHSILKRLFALTMSLLMLCSLMPATALAEESDPLTLTQVLDGAEELTLPYEQEVTLSTLYLDAEEGASETYLRYVRAYHYQNTGTEEVAIYYSAYRTTDVAVYLYQKEAEGGYERTALYDEDIMPGNGEYGQFTVAAGEEYWIMVRPISAETTATIDVAFSTTELPKADPPVSLTQALDEAEELTLPYEQEVDLDTPYLDAYDDVYYGRAYHYQNTGTEDVAIYYSAYRDTDMAVYLYQKVAEGGYEGTYSYDADTMPGNGEDGTFTVAAGEEYWILISPISANALATIDITFSIAEDTSEQPPEESDPLTLTQLLDGAEELTLPYEQTVTLGTPYIDSNDDVYYVRAYHYQNTSTEEVTIYYSAYWSFDSMVTLYGKDTDGYYEQIDHFDNDNMNYYGEEGAFTVAAGKEYWIVISPNYDGYSAAIDVTFVALEDTSEQMVADATAISALPYTADITETADYVAGGKIINGAVYSLAMTKDQTVFLRTAGNDPYNCTTTVFAPSEDGELTYLTKLDSGYVETVITGSVFQAPADGTYYFVACGSDSLEMVAFTGQYHPIDTEDKPTTTPVTELPFTDTKNIGGAAGDYWEDTYETEERYYGASIFQYSMELTEGQTILPTILWEGSPLSYDLTATAPEIGALDLSSSMTFAAPTDGEYIFTFSFYDYPWQSSAATISLKDVSDLPTEADLIPDATPLTLGQTTTQEGVEALIGGYFDMSGRMHGVAAAFSLELKAGTEYYFQGGPNAENYIFEETDKGRYVAHTGFDYTTQFSTDTDRTIYIVSMADEAGALSMTAWEMVDNSLNFTDPNNLPTPGEDDLWSWDNDTLTLTLQDGFTLVSGYAGLYLPDGATIIVDGEVSLQNLDPDYDCIDGQGELTIKGKEVDEDGNPTAVLNITTNEDGIDADGITIEDLIVNIDAYSDGIYAGASLTMDNCVLTITSDSEGIDCDNAQDENGDPIGTCTITDSVVTIASPWDEAIDVDILTLENCVTTLKAGHGENADGSYEAIDAEVSVTIDGGSFEAVSYVDNAITSPILTVTEGTKLNLVTYSSYNVINSDDMTLPGGIIKAKSCVTTDQYGDLNSDGEVTAEDALLALQIATGKIDATLIQTIVGDVDGSDDVAANDALLILQHATQKITQFPVEIAEETPDDGGNGGSTGGAEIEINPDTGIGSGDGADDTIV